MDVVPGPDFVSLFSVQSLIIMFAEPGGAGRLSRRATTVFFDDFSSGHIDAGKWQHAVTGNGGGVSTTV